MWKAVVGLIDEVELCKAKGATTAAMAMTYICIDTMAFLSLPADKRKQGRDDFIAWVDTHLKAHPDQPYQYRGLDVYGARCSLLHAFSSETSYHDQHPDAKRFAYHDGGKHAYDPAQDELLVIIGTESFINDVVCAVGDFMEVCKTDPDLRGRVEARLPRVLQTFSYHTE